MARELLKKYTPNSDLNQISDILFLDQSDLKNNISRKLKKMGMLVNEDIGYVYAQGELPILLVAHLDTYSNQTPILLFRNKNNFISGNDGIIGGDDRCGVYAILKILESLNPHVLFTVGEELGGLGAIMASRKLKAPDVKYIIELDRSGYYDCVFYRCGNPEFREYIESFGFTTKQGTASDISILGPAWDIATVNLSVGYYNAHTVDEYIDYLQLENTIGVVKNILNDFQNVPYFNYQDNFEPTKISEYLHWDDEGLEKILAGYTMMIDAGYSFKKLKQKKK